MARQCHLNTCPAGIATQDKTLRQNYKGKPKYLVTFMKKLAGDVRTLPSEIGFGSIDEIIGRNDLLMINEKHLNWIKERNIDLSNFIAPRESENYYVDCKVKYKPARPQAEHYIGEEIIEEVRPAIITHGRAIVNRKIKNTDRAVGTNLAGLISFLYGLSEFKGYIQYRTDGTAGQSFGAILVDNVELRHCGVANHYVGKGMSGGLITIRFPRSIRKSLEGNTIIGNVALYGATGGKLFVAGTAVERFAVRNSGAAAVVEGVGNHCCEYMTRGFVIVLGEIGKNFGAGMTGGLAFIYDDASVIELSVNKKYVKIDELKPTDEDLVFKYLVNHKFHTGSTIAGTILDNWEITKNRFVKIVPRALDIVDLDKIYEEQFKS